MELRHFAERILLSPDIDTKLQLVEEPWTDTAPGEMVQLERPARPETLQFAERRQGPPMPPFKAFRNPAKRAIAHHIMANHELLALEVMASVLLKFPAAHPEFRQGVARVMLDEQRHTRMHIERAAMLGVTFGDYPVNGYFWEKSRRFECELDYLAGLPLTFEGGNLDHTLEFAEAFEAAGDTRGAALMRVIHRDEIDHVRFGWEWLLKLKPPEKSAWETYVSHLHWPLRPEKARGKSFHREPRLAAGLSPEFIELLATVGPTPPPEK